MQLTLVNIRCAPSQDAQTRADGMLDSFSECLKQRYEESWNSRFTLFDFGDQFFQSENVKIRQNKNTKEN